MTRAVRRDPIYRHRRFSPEIIETCVRWYITYRMSYRDRQCTRTHGQRLAARLNLLTWGHYDARERSSTGVACICS